MDTHWKKDLDHLFSITKNDAELDVLLRALLTPAEYVEIVMRWQIVKMLIEGRTQRQIRDLLGVSIATVTRGARELKYGSGILLKCYDRLYPGRRKSK